MQVPRERTPLSPAEMAPIFARAYEELTGAPLTRPLAEVGLAIVGLENGQGEHIFTHNWGNIVWVGDGDWFASKDGKRWRAQPSHDAGARSWWRLILRKYGRVLEAAARGDARAAVRELYAAGYIVPHRRDEWTDAEAARAAAKEKEAYASAVESIARQYRDAGLFETLSDVGRPAGGWLFLAAVAVIFTWGWVAR